MARHLPKAIQAGFWQGDGFLVHFIISHAIHHPLAKRLQVYQVILWVEECIDILGDTLLFGLKEQAI